MATRIEDLIKVGPAVWPGKELKVQPADMNRFAPMGCGLGNPGVMMPWDDLSDAMSRGGYYGLEAHSNQPLMDAPVTDAAGGTVYFDSRPKRSDVDMLLRLMEVHTPMKAYVAFVARADEPKDQRFLVQLRIVGPSALGALFSAGIDDATKALFDQSLTVGDLLWRFIEVQQEEWGDGYSYNLEGTMGGDGDWAREKLSFGFMVENAYHGVYRIWSRAWLVTK